MREIDRSRASTACSRRAHWLGLAIICAPVASPGRTHAQPADATAAPGETIRPWAAAVSEADQATALALYRAGNLEFAESRFAQALAKYRDAIRHWDHPAIRFNMAVCLINLDQPVEAKDNLERSLAYGEGPLGVDAYGQGLTYRKLLDAQLARVKIVCRDPGTEVTLDGKFLFSGPGSREEVLLPGGHQVVATKTESLAVSKALVLIAGKLTTYDIPPLELDVATRMVRRWEAWKPWAVVGGGGTAVAIGAISYLAAKHNYASYSKGVDARCPHGCDAAMLGAFSDLRHQRDRADVEQVLAFSLFSAGGAALLVGTIGLILNQPRVQFESRHARPAVALVPGGATLTMNWGF